MSEQKIPMSSILLYNLATEEQISFKRKVWLFDRRDYDNMRNDINANHRESLQNNNINIYTQSISNRIISASENTCQINL